MPTPRLAFLTFIAAGLVSPLGGALAVEDKAAQPERPAAHATESLEDCMRKWDPGTHMTKETWRETCLRIKNEREPYVKGYR
jgi:hypothetical protein